MLKAIVSSTVLATTIAALTSTISPALAQISDLNDLPRVERKLLGGSKTPWSRPIMVYDSFTEKSFPAVMDINYHNKCVLYCEQNGIVTMWTLGGINAVYYYRNEVGKVTSVLDEGLQVKVDGKVYALPSIANSMYPMTPELYQALMKSEGKVFVRGFHNGRQHDTEIGRRTVKAYQELGNYLSRQ